MDSKVSRKEKLKELLLTQAAIYKPNVKENNRAAFVNHVLEKYFAKMQNWPDDVFFRVVAWMDGNVDRFPSGKDLMSGFFAVKDQINNEKKYSEAKRMREEFKEADSIIRQKVMKDMMNRYLIPMVGKLYSDDFKKHLAFEFGYDLGMCELKGLNQKILDEVKFRSENGKRFEHSPEYYVINLKILLNGFLPQYKDDALRGFERARGEEYKMDNPVYESIPEAIPEVVEEKLPF